jgi:hypothetical protein
MSAAPYAAADEAIRSIRGGNAEAVLARWCEAIGRQSDYARMGEKSCRSIIAKAIWAAEAHARQVARLHRVLLAMLDDAKA